MGMQIFPPQHIWKPIKVFCIGFTAYFLLVAAAFSFVRDRLEDANDMRSLLAAVPGITMCGIFWLLYGYFRRTDELAQRIALHALALSCIAGLATLVISISRSAIGGYSEFTGGTILSVMNGTFFVSALLLTWKYR